MALAGKELKVCNFVIKTYILDWFKVVLIPKLHTPRLVGNELLKLAITAKHSKNKYLHTVDFA